VSAAQPGAWGNFVGILRGEVDAGVLEAFRRAGSGVYDLADEVDEKRRLLCLAGRSPWQFPLPFQTELLCAWNALVCQSVGDRLLLDDYRQNPLTQGLVPPATFETAERFYGQVRGWLIAARMASDSERFRTRGPLPALLPRWSSDPAMAVARIRILQSLCDYCLARLDPVMGWYLELRDDKVTHAETHDAMRQLFAEAQARSDYADDLLVEAEPSLLGLIDRELQDSFAKLFALGQYAAMPGLLRNALDRG
jgi:hypothetical protein